MLDTSRPWALITLWIILMLPLSLAGIALQGVTGIPYEVFPLVMAGPAVAALICRVAVPSWFPPDAPAVGGRARLRSVLVLILASCAFLAVLFPVAGDGPAALPQDWPEWLGIAVVIIGITAGSWMEELGYRGTMYRALAARLSPWWAVVVNGVFFGLCHLQYFGAGWLAVTLFVSSAVFMNVVMVSAWAGPWRERVLIATGFHAFVNIALALRGTPMTALNDYIGLTAATAAAALVALVASRVIGIGDLANGSDGQRRGVSAASATTAAP